MDKLSYALGLGIGQNLLSMGTKGLIVEDFAQGVSDVLSSRPTAISHVEAREIVTAYFKELEATTNKVTLEQGQLFLEENKKRPSVKCLPSGLQYEILKAGTGPKPKPFNKVQCHYRGTLIDGTEFDSSLKRGTPAVFGVTQVIQGWVEALQLMPQGSKWKLYIPQNLAYGSQGAGQSIPPYSALVFEIELLKIL